jgi:RHH-type proline utilization regulon transcriptional repressor/proline dehydrogenase/delta 1-pyrroline-5-carboxylate dehydrogenase
VHFAGGRAVGQFRRAAHLRTANAGQLTEEVFGPIPARGALPAENLGEVLRAIEATGYGLTLGNHSRIDDAVEDIVDRAAVGNIYVNRT